MYRLTIALIILFTNFSDFAHYTIVRILPIIFFSAIIFQELIIKKPKINFLNRNFCLLNILAVILIISIIISTRKDVSIDLRAFRILTFLSFVIAFFNTAFNYVKNNDLLTTFVNFAYKPLLFFLSINLFLFFLGFKASDYNIGQAVILSYFGLAIERVEFFLSPGINAYGAVLGIAFNLSLIGFGIVKQKRNIFLSGLIISLISLLLTDSRGAIIFPVIIYCSIKFFFSNLKKPKLLWIVPIIGFVGPFLLLSTLLFLSQTDYGAVVSRSSEDLATGNARSIIWGIAFNDFLAFKPEHHLFGYGEYGQYAAGLSQQWSYIFGDNENAEFMHPHNIFLSIALDYGYFGLIIFTLVQYSIIKAIIISWTSQREVSYLLLGNILYFNLAGITETMFGFYYQNIVYLFFMINLFAFILRYFNKKNQSANVRSNQIYPIPYSASGGTSFERSPIHAGLVQFRSGEEKQELSAANS
ncbi:O-antigen ligase family protein [Spirosoma sp. RP8]|uniref:O-antigen ligase family protein n=1 Tax=Spirosoma liriopis TaxID=2937440 RepID=A0ABT0HKT4_9BACT|nr:O-antigen ligase family protein [Spirosoma liriopis]MCK8492774.1 O-antigen ligase family protein [Spirosoma liriopis]